MKATINKDACIGCGACQAVAPTVFEIGEEGTAEVKSIEINEEMEDEVKDAVEGCPTSAISIDE